MLPVRAPRLDRHRASARRRPGERPPRPRPGPESYKQGEQDAGAADRRRRRPLGSTRTPSGRRLLLFGRMDRTKADLDPVPGVDLRDQQGELHLLVLGKVLAQRLVGIVRRMGLGHQRQSFGPAQRGSLAVGIKRGLAPRAEKMKPVLGLSVLAGICYVMVDTEGASVNL